MPSHSGINGNEMADFLIKVVFKSEQQTRRGIEVKQIETSLSFAEANSLIRVHCTEKWNHHYKAYPAGDHYRFIFAHASLLYNFSSENIFRLQTCHCLLKYH